ncbi:MAG: arginine deiminase-related protein [Bacteroidia bacterium]
MTQLSAEILLIRPASFGFNEQTASTNSFQQNQKNPDQIHAQALMEFDEVIDVLKKNNISCRVINDTEFPSKPDAVFPNNWFSTHENKVIVTYPMMAENRRAERRSDVIDLLRKDYGYITHIDFSHYEASGQFLEGTGSIVFDRSERIAYAALSPRTDRDVLLECCEMLGYLPLLFQTKELDHALVYHTNVLLSLHPELAVVCEELIIDEDRHAVIRMLEVSGKAILRITKEQVKAFAGNLLFVKNQMNENCVLISTTAIQALNQEQLKKLEAIAKIIPVTIPVIETAGGGGIRCMAAELF